MGTIQEIEAFSKSLHCEIANQPSAERDFVCIDTENINQDADQFLPLLQVTTFGLEYKVAECDLKASAVFGS